MKNIRQYSCLDSILGAIGNTPLVELKRFTMKLDGRILAKLEYLNPGFSKKDRNALQMIEEAAKARPDSGRTDQRQHGNRSVHLSVG
jgi:cysteine synthase